jgi:hypothetical protein
MVEFYNKLEYRYNKLEIELEQAHGTIANLRGELGKWKSNSENIQEFFFFTEVASLLKDYKDVVFLPDKNLSLYKIRNRQNGPWNDILKDEIGNSTSLTKQRLLRAKAIVDGAKFTEAVSSSPFLKTFNTLKGVFSCLDIGEVEGKFYKYKFSHSHGKSLGIYFPKTISGRRDVEKAYEAAYGPAVVTEREHFQLYITQTAYAQALDFLMYMTTWQDFSLIVDAEKSSNEIGAKEKEKSAEEISRFRRDSAYLKKREEELTNREIEIRKKEEQQKKIKEATNKGEETNIKEKITVVKETKHNTTQTNLKTVVDSNIGTNLTMDDISELQSVYKKMRTDLAQTKQELKEANMKAGTATAERRQLKIEREANDKSAKLLNEEIERLKKNDVVKDLKIIQLEHLVESLRENEEKIRKRLENREEEISDLKLVIDNIDNKLSNALKEKNQQLTDENNELIKKTNSLIEDVSLLRDDYLKLDEKHQKLLTEGPTEKSEDIKMREFLTGMDKAEDLKKARDDAIGLLCKYSDKMQQVLDAFRVQLSTHESIAFLQDVIARVCEAEMNLEVNHRTSRYVALQEDFKACQRELEDTKIQLREFQASNVLTPLKVELKQVFNQHLNKEVTSFRSSILDMKKDIEGLHTAWSKLKNKKKTLKEASLEQTNELKPKVEELTTQKGDGKKREKQQTTGRSTSAPRDRSHEKLWVHLDQSEITFDDWYARCDIKPFLSNDECRPHDDRMCQGEWWMQKNVNQRLLARRRRA